MTITKEQIAKDLLSIRAVFLKPDDPFTWASGIHSPIYCDNRLTLSAPAVRKDVEAGLAEIVKEKFPEAEMLMGTSTAANTDSLVQCVSQACRLPKQGSNE